MQDEWEFVVDAQPDKRYPHEAPVPGGRVRVGILALLACEVLSLSLYPSPSPSRSSLGTCPSQVNGRGARNLCSLPPPLSLACSLSPPGTWPEAPVPGGRVRASIVALLACEVLSLSPSLSLSLSSSLSLSLSLFMPLSDV